MGKLGIPDYVLLKPAALTADKWVFMRRRPEYAQHRLAPIAYLRPALDIPYCHHEKWDAGGYPRQLKADAIPLSAHIFAVMDVWDALRSNRPYRPGWPPAQVRACIREQAGQHFESAVVEVFLGLDLPA